MGMRGDAPYRNLICAVLDKGMQDAVKGKFESDRAWLFSEGCAELCSMVDIDHEYFRGGVLAKIREHERRKKRSVDS